MAESFITWQLFVEGSERMHAALTKLAVETAQGGGAARATEAEMAAEARGYANLITHRLTGSLAASHVVFAQPDSHIVTPNPNAFNPLSRRKVTDYAIHEHNRGGSHAFYERTIREAGARILANAAKGYVARLEKATP